MPRVARITGLDGEPTSALGTLSFATPPLPGGIAPCWSVGYANPDGSTGNLMITPSSRGSDFVTTEPPSPIRGTDWTTHSFQVHLPPGTTILTLTVGIDVTSDPPEPIRVAFDNVTAAGHTWTWIGDNLGL